MPHASDLQLSGLSSTERERLQALLAEFARSWTESRLAAAAKELPADCGWRRVALAEMVKIDLERQWQHGRRPKVHGYLHFHPELGSPENVPADLLLAEYQARVNAGDSSALDELMRRYPRQAAALRELVEQARGTLQRAKLADPGTPTAGVATIATGAAVGVAPALPEQFGRYRILQQLGQGGMGAVYLVHDTELDRRVALKVPRLPSSGETTLIKRFRREARAVAALQHPNICQVHDVGEVNGVQFLTMAYVEGLTLSNVLATQPMPALDAAILVQKLAGALRHAHERGVLHRDLKPGNVILNANGEPVLMDFGLALRITADDIRMTPAGTALGTPAYMSPEQVRGETTDYRSDVYALGVLLYECLTRQLPFIGQMHEVMGQILFQEPPRPREHVPTLNSGLESICLRMMAKQPGDRYQSMADVERAISEYLAWHSSSATPMAIPVIAPVTPPPPKRRRLAVVIIGCAVMLIAAVVIIANLPKDNPKNDDDGHAGDDKPADKVAVNTDVKPPVKDGEQPPRPQPGLKPGQVAVCRGHTGTPTCVALSPDGAWLATGSTDETLRIWDAKTGTLKHKLTGHLHDVLAVEFSPDGKHLASASAKGGYARQVKVWDVPSGELKTDLQWEARMSPCHNFCLAFSRDGKMLAMAGSRDTSVRLWDLTGGKQQNAKVAEQEWFQTIPASTYAMAFSPDGKTLALADYDSNRLRLYPVERQGKAAPDTIEGAKEYGREEHGMVRFRPDGSLDWVNRTGMVTVWDRMSVTKLDVPWVGRNYYHSLTQLPEGKLMIASGYGSARTIGSYENDKVTVWWSDAPKETRTFATGQKHVAAVDLSPDGKYLATTGTDYSVIVWDTAWIRKQAAAEQPK